MRLSSTRLVFAYIAVVTVMVSLLLITVYWLTLRALESELTAVVQTETDSLIDEYDEGDTSQLIKALKARRDQWGRTGALYLLADSTQSRLAGNLNRWPDSLTARAGRVQFTVDATDSEGSSTHRCEALLTQLPNDDWLLVGTDTSEQRRFSARFLSATLWGTGLTAFFMALVGIWYSRRVRQRVQDYAVACQTIIAGDLGQRLPLDGSHDEFDALGATVNRVLDRLEQQTITLRTTFGSAAHDLRAPLYRLRVRLEEALLQPGTPVATQELVDSVVHELDRVQRTLSTLLQIAQSEARGVITATELVDIAKLANELTDLFLPEAKSFGLELQIHAAAPVRVVGNRQLLAQLVANLIENALKYVPAGGRVRICVANKSGNKRGVLIVEDNGPGIAAHERERAIQPFQRVGNQQGTLGSGLGLALVSAVVRLHGGTLALADNAPGLRVTCEFPLADVASATPSAAEPQRSRAGAIRVGPATDSS